MVSIIVRQGICHDLSYVCKPNRLQLDISRENWSFLTWVSEFAELLHGIPITFLVFRLKSEKITLLSEFIF